MTLSSKEVEDSIVKIRTERCNATIAKLLGGDANGPMPRVGICLSGGGWRAMTSSCALLDALSTPLAPSETFTNAGGVKLLDTVSHAFGLSGGSWALFTTLAGGERNPFHNSPDPKVPAVSHPWLYGEANSFDENVHTYEGLAHMVAQDTIDRACYRSSARQVVGFLSSAAGADTAIASTMVSDRLGNTLVERWSNFISNGILNFVDVRNGVAPPSVPPADPKKDSKVQDAEILAAARGNPSRNIDFSSLKELVARGDLPFIVCSAIANRPRNPDERPSPLTRAYDWVELTPWFARNPPQNIDCSAVEGLSGHLGNNGTEGTAAEPLKMHNLMAICGSAFACDVACALPSGVSALVQKHVNVTSEPILGGGITTVQYQQPGSSEAPVPFGRLRDAGIDFNVPLPPMLAEAGRSFDVIIVHDAGAGSKNAFELHRAIELGYLKLLPGSLSPLEPFAPGERVRVFRGVGGFPTIIYFIGLTERGTHQVVQKQQQLLREVRALREDVLKQLLPVILSELRVAKARLVSGSFSAPPQPQSTAPTQQLAVVRTSHTRRAIRLDAEEEEEVDELEEDQRSTTNRTHPLKPLAESLVVNAMTAGKVRDTIDAYLHLENALLGSLPVGRRTNIIIALEERSYKTITLPAGEVALLPPISSVIDIPELCEVLVEFGVLERVNPRDPLRKEANLTPAFVDFYATTAILGARFPNSEVLKRVGIPPSAPRDGLESVRWFNKDCPCSKVWNLLFSALVKLGQFETAATVVKYSLPEFLCLPGTVDEVDLSWEQSAISLVDACEELGADKETVAALFGDVCAAVQAKVPAALDALLVLARTAAARGRSDVLLRIVIGLNPHSGYQAPFVTLDGELRQRSISLITDSVYRNPSASLRKKLLHAISAEFHVTVTFDLCCKYALPNIIREFVPQHLDDHGAVSAILDATDRNASTGAHKQREACAEEIWKNGVASNIFRDWIVEECVNKRQFYWMFLAPRVREVKVPEGASPEVAQAAVAFAEKCKRLQLINVPGNLAHDVRSRLGELEARMLGRKDVIEQKVAKAAVALEGVASAAKAVAAAKVAGLFGRFSK